MTCRDLFLTCLDSLAPDSLLSDSVLIDQAGQTLRLCRRGRQYSLRSGCHVVGFGKAVLGLAAALVTRLGKEKVRGGVLSVPVGTGLLSSSLPLLDTCRAAGLEVMEGAEHNLPDERSEEAARRLVETVSHLTEDDLVLVLISGGGSSLLSLPASGVTGQDKREVVRSLARAGADITEVNTIRKSLSAVKGGKLARTISPAKTVSLILSDVIGDPLEVIASGPTVLQAEAEPQQRLDILAKYGLTLSEELMAVISRGEVSGEPRNHIDVENVLIGSNKQPLAACQREAARSVERVVLVTRSLQGEARTVGQRYAQLVLTLCLGLEEPRDLSDLLSSLGAEEEQEKIITEYGQTLRTSGGSLLLLSGGETTVKVTGDGVGGRNQELVLSFALALASHQTLLRDGGYHVEMLSAGTDGIDGPSPAAGAVWTSEVNLRGNEAEARDSLERNDSHSYLSQIPGALLVTGHTGTNVADIVMCKIVRKK